MELCFRIPIISGITNTLNWIPNSKAQDSGLHKQKFPGPQILQLPYTREKEWNLNLPYWQNN